LVSTAGDKASVGGSVVAAGGRKKNEEVSLASSPSFWSSRDREQGSRREAESVDLTSMSVGDSNERSSMRQRVKDDLCESEKKVGQKGEL